MSRLFLVLAIACSVSATCMPCFIQEKKDEPEIHVIHLDESTEETDDSKVVALEIPDFRRRRDTESKIHRTVCKHDSDCNAGEVCIPHLTCVNGHRVARRSLMDPVTGQHRSEPSTKRRRHLKPRSFKTSLSRNFE